MSKCKKPVILHGIVALMAEFTNRALIMGKECQLSSQQSQNSPCFHGYLGLIVSHKGAAPNIHPHSGLEELLGPGACRTAELCRGSGGVVVGDRETHPCCLSRNQSVQPSWRGISHTCLLKCNEPGLGVGCLSLCVPNQLPGSAAAVTSVASTNQTEQKELTS